MHIVNLSLWLFLSLTQYKTHLQKSIDCFKRK